MSVSRVLKIVNELLILKQTIFALPFAYIGVLLAGLSLAVPEVPSFRVWLLVTLAMVFARTAGMSLNRLIDHKIDAENPRTKNRTLPSGRISRATVIFLSVFSLAGLVLSAYFLNPLCFYLSPLAALLLFGYSFCKRFTWFSHFVLGIVEAFAPIGGWFAVTGSFDWRPIVLGFLIVFWMVGLDVIYACQDFEHDRKAGLYSIPARFGLKVALLISRFSHFLCMVCLVITGVYNDLSYAYWIGLLIVGGLFIYEHKLVSPNDLSKVQIAFFKANSWVAVVLVTVIGLDVFLSINL